ncbi:tetratricopeptide repeat-containing sensor histidine kinase [Tenacibaculum insulae]|uniref:tetratricopeptide repeat-containing sensor histidine kinase n=1 Tax=Tenacibaculum insulae TaxID=2029677 RepID=UPI003AB82212
MFKLNMDKALSFFRERNLDSFKKYSQYSYTLTKEPKNLQKVHFYLATYYKYSNVKDSAYFHYNKSKNILLHIGDSISAGRRMVNIADIQYNENDFIGSEITSIESLRYIEKYDATTLKHDDLHIVKHKIYRKLGLIASKKNKLNDALKYYDLSLLQLKKDSVLNIKLELGLLNDKGLLYQFFNQHKKAITFFKKGLLRDSIQLKYPAEYTLLLENLAASNFLLGNKKKVLAQYKEVLAINEQLNNIGSLSITHINISNYYRDSNQKEKAIYHSKEALKFAQKANSNENWLKALLNLSKLTKGKESNQYLQEYIRLNYQILQKERLLKNRFAKIEYETEKKEKENTVLKSENEKKQAEITYQKQQKIIGWLFAASSILLLGLSIMFFFQRRRKLLYQAQLERIQAREDERQQIAKSLHDEVAGDLRLLHRKLEKSNLIEEAKKLDDVKENVRNLSHQLSSISFDKVTFKDQIINLVSDYFELDFRITVKGLHENQWKTINDAIKRLLYLSMRESIQNCKKYAQASKVTINFTVEKKYVHLNIADNGIGFDTKISKKGIGLQNLQERIEGLNGTLIIDSKVGNGTKTSIQIPLNA